MARRQLEGLRILITGASQGIGRALADQAARRGARVVAVARSAALLQELKEQLGPHGANLEIATGDVTQAEDRQRMIDVAVKSFGGLDVLVNNAGVGATGHFAEAGPDRLRQIMEVNYFAPVELTRLAIPLMRMGRTPALVNISSVAGKRAIPARSEYSASKFAVEGFSESLRPELSKDGIDVLVVCPGLTQTNFSHNMIEQKARMPMDHMRGMTAEAVAEATLKALKRGKREIILTWQARAIALVNRFFPRLADRIAARKVRALFPEEIAARQQKKLEREKATH